MPDAHIANDLTATGATEGARLQFMERLVDEKFRSRDIAVDVAIAALNVRLNGMNEFRETLRDQAARFVTREEFSVSHSALEHSVGEARIVLSKWVARSEETEKNATGERSAFDKRLESVNEFRNQLKDQSATFVTRKELDLMISLITADARRLEHATAAGAKLVDMNAALERGNDRIRLIEAKSNHSDSRLWILAIAFIFISGALSWIISNIHVSH